MSRTANEYLENDHEGPQERPKYKTDEYGVSNYCEACMEEHRLHKTTSESEGVCIYCGSKGLVRTMKTISPFNPVLSCQNVGSKKTLPKSWEEKALEGNHYE